MLHILSVIFSLKNKFDLFEILFYLYTGNIYFSIEVKVIMEKLQSFFEVSINHGLVYKELEYINNLTCDAFESILFMYV